MEFFIKRVKTLYENSSSLLLASALVYVFSSLWGMGGSVFFILAVGLVTIAVLKLLEGAKNKVFAVVFPVLLLGFFFLLCALLKLDAVAHIKGLVRWAANFFTSGAEVNTLYAYLLIGFLTAAAGVLCKFLDGFYAARIAVAAALLGGGLILSVNALEMPKFSVCIGLFYILNRLIELVNNTVRRTIRMKDSKGFASYLMPICMLAALFAAVLPSKAEPIQWEGVKRAAAAVVDKAGLLLTEIQLLFDSGDGLFSVGYSGYSENTARLGGTILENDGVMLNLKVFSKTKANLYLTGAVCNEYTGDRWKYTAQDEDYETDEYLLDFYELLNALGREGISPEELPLLIERKDYKITYDGVKTKSLLYPLKSYSIELSESSRNANFSGTNLLFNRVKGRGTAYSAEFVDVNYEGEVFSGLLRGLEGFRYRGGSGADFAPYLKSYLRVNGTLSYTPSELNAVFERRAERIRADYLSLPDSVPERVYALAEEITKGYDNSYDKLKALEAYLNTYEYTTAPPEIPRGRDAVDYFLFEEKQGYCTYFATAMAVMGRCVGVPTRYVEGASVDFANPSKDSYYNVLNKNAHAWTEAYLEGAGWIPFEPTSGYSRYGVWQEKTGTASAAPLYTPEDFLQDFMPKVSAAPLGDLPEIQPEGSGVDYSKLLSALSILVLAVLFVVAAFLAYYCIVQIRYRQKFKKADNNRRLFLLFGEIFYHLKLFRLELEAQDTILTFAERVGRRFVFDGMTFYDAAEIFMKARYAGREISDGELRKIAAFEAGIQKDVVLKCGRMRALFLRFLYYCR